MVVVVVRDRVEMRFYEKRRFAIKDAIVFFSLYKKKMLAKTLEINWHDGQAIYSVDFSPDGSRYATAGADNSVRVSTHTHNQDIHQKILNRHV